MILIDMQMPDSCYECRFETERGFCKAMPEDFCGYTNYERRPEWCPLKEQEVVKIKVKKINGSGRCGRCPSCNNELNETDYPNYCGFCGQEVKWK